MKWLIVAAIVIVLFAVAWWSSGRARPMGSRRQMSDTEKSAHQGYAQRNSHNNGASGFSI